MTARIIKYISILFLVVVTFASCKVVQTYQKPSASVEGLYRNRMGADTQNLGKVPWRDLFTDPILQELIEKGIANNPDLKIAYERINQSRAYFIQSGAAFEPSLNANANVGFQKYAPNVNSVGGNSMQYQLGIGSTWEIDIWGKLASSKRAAFATLIQTEAAKNVVQTQIVSTIANYYYALLALDQQLAITSQTVKNWDTTVQTMIELKTASRVTEAAVVQSKAQRYAAEVTIPDLIQSIKKTENALNILIGNKPGPIKRGALPDQKMIEIIHEGIPFQLLSQRPDVLQAENNFRYYFELTNVARTAFYPSLSINGSASMVGTAVDKLFSANAFGASIGAGLLQPVFNNKLNKTRLSVAQSQQREALINYQKILLNAGREVSDAISAYETSETKKSIRENQLIALEQSVEYSQELLKNGFATYPEVITANQSLLQAELGRVTDRLSQLQAVVELYRALGGGWQ